MPAEPGCWLVKTEPECFSIHDLAASPGQTTCWDGVRNYQARNFLRDSMKLGDRVLFYHSNADPPAVVGTARVVREAYPDHTAWDPQHMHFDPAASPANPIWQMVDLRFESVFRRPLGLDELRTIPELAGMELLRRGSRLSVQPVSAQQFAVVVALAERGAPADGGGTSKSPLAKSTKSKAARGTARVVKAAKTKPGKTQPEKTKAARPKAAPNKLRAAKSAGLAGAGRVAAGRTPAGSKLATERRAASRKVRSGG